MTREEAEVVLRGILEGKVVCYRPGHFCEEMFSEGFTVQDINPILRSHRMVAVPEWREKNCAHRVRLAGKCLEGRAALLVVDLRTSGPCAYVSIMVDKGRRTR